MGESPSSHCLTLWRLVVCGPRGVFRGKVAAAARTSPSLFTLLDTEGSRDIVSVCHMLHDDIHCKRRLFIFFPPDSFVTLVTLHTF